MISISFEDFKAVRPLLIGLILAWFIGIPRFLYAAVLINEFVYDAAGADTGNEWVELFNTGLSTISVEGWTLEADNNAFPGTVKARLCGSIAPLSYYLIKEDAVTVSSSVLADLVSGTLALGNATTKADGLQLLDGDGNVMDRVVYGSTDSDKLCGAVCVRAPVATNGMSLARSTAGATDFVAVSSMSVTPQSGGGRCAERGCPEGSGRFRGMITEVAPANPSSDFIELFARGSGNLCGVSLYEADTLIKKFPSVIVKENGYVLLHASEKGADETSESGDRNGNGVLDLYSDESSPGLTSTANNNLTLKNSDGSIADFMSWSLVPEDTYSSTKQSAYDLAVSSGYWAPPCPALDAACRVAASVVWFNRSSESMARKVGADGFPKRSAPSNFTDWQVGAQSPGKGYSHSFESKGERLEVFQSPFSPVGDGRHSECVIAYRAAEQSILNLCVYDLQGRKVRQLLDQAVSRSEESQTVSWNGTDDEGRVVAAGVYLLQMDLGRTDGSREKELRTVVVGRKLH